MSRELVGETIGAGAEDLRAGVGLRRAVSARIPSIESQLEEPAIDGHEAAPDVVLIEDDVFDRGIFVERLSSWGYSVSSHPSIEAALAGGLAEPDIVLVDLGLPGVSGWDGVRTIRALQPTCPIIVLTGHSTPGLAETAIERGAHDFVWKDDPDPRALDRTIRRALRRTAFTAVEHFNSMHDPLTGLPNRALLDDRLTTMAAIADRADTKFGALFIDLDRFKQVNDQHGHHVGDRLLVEFARRTSAVMRPSDTVARVGGDEFVVLIGNVVDDRDVDRVAHRIEQALQAPFHDPEVGDLQIRASIGVASARPADVLPSTLLILADRACLEAKSRPGRSIRWSLTRGLAALVDDGGPLPIDLRLEPIVECGRVVDRRAVPSLVDPDDTHLTHEELVHGLRVNDRLAEFDTDVVRSAIRAVECAGHDRVAVGLSWEALRNEVQIDAIGGMIAESTVQVTCDVGEHVLRSDAATARGVARLRAAGARIAVGDFGGGSSDLLDLVDVAVDEVKLHPRFVERLTAADHGGAIIEAAVVLCQRIGLVLVVQGIERPDQLERFEACGATRWCGPLATEHVPT